jgi:hypothetical protein
MYPSLLLAHVDYGVLLNHKYESFGTECLLLVTLYHVY